MGRARREEEGMKMLRMNDTFHISQTISQLFVLLTRYLHASRYFEALDNVTERKCPHQLISDHGFGFVFNSHFLSIMHHLKVMLNSSIVDNGWISISAAREHL